MRIRSALGRGTTVIVRLPLSQNTQADADKDAVPLPLAS
jgi:hypothetical protein